MILRLSKIALLASVALFYTLVVFNNLTDYEANDQFVRHVLQMDTVFPGSPHLGRAIRSPLGETLAYYAIIIWEAAAMVLTWCGVIRLTVALREPADTFNLSKRIPIFALTFGLMLWFVGFLTLGGEWFLMWQSKLWNGQEEAFRMFASIGIVLVVLALPEAEAQP
ncbi:DUF2165 domain-containing protein [Terriglobus saanensis]|uniref:Small integral membrane protein n=1 Tax=Terriglobus saanensis (strain ATCC BAA-1853 / DSM 23119 / SP1PR4) TaxID=401053 RepID=E8UYX4_TERSS|nr:DUF2165 domain-containing protein [Terriglobus saanensis]ADV84340.1 Protein of unknown function DUF2165, transmembrane [Terriglobus saanensis SP1PR4]